MSEKIKMKILSSFIKSQDRVNSTLKKELTALTVRVEQLEVFKQEHKK